MIRESVTPNVPSIAYQEIMSGIEFMHKYMGDPDIFNPDSEKFKSFLIQSFSYLHPDFHYLSFLNKEEIDLEIMKVVGILQILPANNTKKSSKLFESRSKDEIHRFWVKFFGLFKKQNDYNTDSLFINGWENKINFFSDVKSTWNYLNYEFPIVNLDRLKNVNVDEEISNWKEKTTDISACPDESTFFNSEEDYTSVINTENLILDLKQVLCMYNNIKPVTSESKPENISFFLNFINFMKNILQYRNNLNIIDSKILDEFNCKLILNDEKFSETIYFIKRCNNLIRLIKSKSKSVY